MTCKAACCETATGRFFSKHSKRYAKQFRKGKMEKVQELLLEAARAEGVEGKTILDVGCGVGVLHLTLLGEGAVSALPGDAFGQRRADAREPLQGMLGQLVDRDGDAQRVIGQAGDQSEALGQSPQSLLPTDAAHAYLHRSRTAWAERRVVERATRLGAKIPASKK